MKIIATNNAPTQPIGRILRASFLEVSYCRPDSCKSPPAILIPEALGHRLTRVAKTLAAVLALAAPVSIK